MPNCSCDTQTARYRRRPREDYRTRFASFDMLTRIADWQEVSIRPRVPFSSGLERFMQRRRRVRTSVSRPAGSAVDRRPPSFVVSVSNPGAFSGNGSIILLELANEGAALRAARIIARETGRYVTVRNADMALIETIPAASTH